MVEGSGDHVTATATCILSIPSSVLLCRMATGRREICHCFCCISQGLPSLIILGTPQSSLCELCLSLQLAFPGATVLRQRSRQLCWQCVSHAPVPVHDLCGLVPELYSGSLRASLSQLCQPLLSAAGSSASPFPPCHCWLRPWSRPALSNRTLSSDVNVRPVLSTVVAVSQLWPLSI